MKIFNIIIVSASPAGAIAGYTPSETGLEHALPVLQSTGIVCEQHPARMGHQPATR